MSGYDNDNYAITNRELLRNGTDPSIIRTKILLEENNIVMAKVNDTFLPQIKRAIGDPQGGKTSRVQFGININNAVMNIENDENMRIVINGDKCKIFDALATENGWSITDVRYSKDKRVLYHNIVVYIDDLQVSSVISPFKLCNVYSNGKIDLKEYGHGFQDRKTDLVILNADLLSQNERVKLELSVINGKLMTEDGSQIPARFALNGIDPIDWPFLGYSNEYLTIERRLNNERHVAVMTKMTNYRYLNLKEWVYGSDDLLLKKSVASAYAYRYGLGVSLLSEESLKKYGKSLAMGMSLLFGIAV
ncbi:MAG: hypothetical protein GY938_13320, partial [Ketobacter sp.]|nr:hypothetical protein [Ketobacter sp.]